MGAGAKSVFIIFFIVKNFILIHFIISIFAFQTTKVKLLKLLLIDNYDSFTFNLLHYLEQLCENITVKRNDEIGLKDVEDFSHIVLSPGPGLPKDAGICLDIIKTYSSKKSILGICLGHQAIAEYFGFNLYNQEKVAHGRMVEINKSFSESWLLKGIPDHFKVGLYHSWAVNFSGENKQFQAVAESSRGINMAFEHRHLAIAGLQFHPESIMSEYGIEILKNWLFHHPKSL